MLKSVNNYGNDGELINNTIISTLKKTHFELDTSICKIVQKHEPQTETRFWENAS